MERPSSPAREHLKEIAWALLLFTLMLGLVGLLMAQYLGTATALWLFLGVGAGISAVLGGVAVLNVLLVWLYERWERRRAGRSTGATRSAPRRSS